MVPRRGTPGFTAGQFRRRWQPVFAIAIVAAALVLSGALTSIQGAEQTVGANVAGAAAPASTVDAQCAPGGDCAKKISDAIRTNQARPLKVTFGGGSPAGTVFNFNTQVLLSSDVAIVGINQPVAKTSAATLARIGGTSNVTFQGFDVDLDRCSRTKNVFYNAADQRFSNVLISDMRVFNGDSENGEGGSCVLFASRGTGADLQLRDVTAENLRRVLWFNTVSSHRDVLIRGMIATDFGYQALSFDGYVENVFIEASRFSRHASNVKGSHIIAFSPAETLTEIKSKNLVVRDSILEGRQNIPHIKIDGVTQANGASGDLIAVRGTAGFTLEGNTFRHGGEVGITITAGARDGIVRNNTVSHTDTTGIVLGNGNTIRVTNVDVYNNDLFQNSLDRDGTHRPLPALSVWGATNSCVVHNKIHDNPQATGLWVWNGHMPPTWPRSVKDVYITENSFSNNLHDFVQSSRPTRDFEPASSLGGSNWTSTFGSPDADGDGFGDVCSSETNDQNPCVPLATAAACGNPPPPTATTVAPPTTATTAPATSSPATTNPATTNPATTNPATTSPATSSPATTGPATTAPPATNPATTKPSLPEQPTETGSLRCNGLAATIVGTEGDDVLIGTNRRDVIVGLGGNDIIEGEIGPDVICGGDGDDDIRGGRDNDFLSGGAGNDVIRGGRNNDIITGGVGDDLMFGNNGRDIMDGGDGEDTVRGNGGRDSIRGGAGIDYLAGNGDRDLLFGGTQNDTLIGGSHGDQLDGGGGIDACAAGSGADSEESCETVPRNKNDEYDNKIDNGNLD